MIVIRDAQIAALQASRDDAFAAWAAGHLRRTCAAEVASLDEGEIRRRARIGLSRARGAGFSEPSQIADYLVLMVRYAPDFDDHPEVRRALADGARRGAVLSSLPRAVDAAVWAEVRARRDDRAWAG